MSNSVQIYILSGREFFTNSAILALDRCKLCTLPGNGGIKSNQPKEILYARFQRIEPVHGFIDFALFYCAIWLLLRDRFCCERGYRTVRSTATSTWMEIWRGTSARLIPKQNRYQSTHGQVQPVMTSESNVTAPFRASALPSRFTPVVSVMDVSAKMFPLNSEFVPSVAELPTCQKTLQALAPLARIT